MTRLNYNLQDFFIGNTFQGSLTNACRFVYLTGILNVDRNFTFNQTRIFTGQSAGINIGSAPLADNLTLRNGTIVEPMQTCPCMWRGINVNIAGRLTVNPIASEARVEVRQAMFAIRAIRRSLGVNPNLSINSLDLDRNFIGLRLTDGPYALTRFSGVNITGGNIGKSRCWSCPMIINDLVDSDGPNAIEGGVVNPVFANSAFLGSFAPPFSTTPVTVNNNPTINYSINNTTEQDFPFDYSHSYAGIMVDGIRPAGFGVNNAGPLTLSAATNAPVINTFNDLESGIVLLGVTGTINQSCSFNNTLDQWYDNNSGDCILFLSDNGANNLTVDGNTFTQSVRGIYVAPYFSPGPGNVTVRNTNMTNMQQGIAVVNDIQVPFTGNFATVDIGPNNNITADMFLTSNNPLPKAAIYGVYVGDVAAEPTRINIHDNIITVNWESLGNFDEAMGIWGEGWRSGNCTQTNTTDCDDVYNNIITMIRARRGIRLVSCESTNVRYNGVTNQQPVVENYDKLVALDGGARVRMSCNTLTASLNHSDQANSYMDGLLSSFHVDGAYTNNSILRATRSAAFSGNCGTASDIKQNDFRGPARVGVLYAGLVPDPLNGVQTTTNTGPQINKGNEWLGAFKERKAFAFAGTDLLNSRWIVPTCNGCSQGPTIFTEVEPNQGWFFSLGSIQQQSACPPISDVFLAPTVTDRDIQVVIKPSTSPGLYFDKLDLLFRLRQNPSFAQQQTDLLTFYQNAQQGNLGKFADALSILQLHAGQNSTALQSMQTLHQQEMVLLQQMETVQVQIANDPDNAIYQAQLNQLELDAAAIVSNKSAASVNYVNSVKAVANTQASIINAISPNDIAETNLKQALMLYFNAIAGTHQPTKAEIDWAATVSKTCPEETGPACYIADAVHTVSTGYSVLGRNCATTGIGERSNDQTPVLGAEVSVYPNPTNGQMVQVQAAFTIQSIRLINPLGEVVHARVFDGSETQISTRFDAPSGLYYLEVNGIGAEKATKAIVVQH